MQPDAPLEASQVIVQACLFSFAAIGMFGGAVQFYLGQPETSQRLDNVHRFMAGIYFTMGLICMWAGFTVRQQGALLYFIAFGVALGGCGRLVSMAKVGLPQPRALWLGYLTPELVLPIVLAIAHNLRP